MKVCLYLEFRHFRKGILFRSVGTGMVSSYENQKVILRSLGIPFAERWDSSCDLLQVNSFGLRSLWLMGRAHRTAKPVIIIAHTTAEDARAVFRFMPYLVSLFKKYLTFIYRRADVIICPSRYTRSLLLRYGLPAEKLVVQSNGVDQRKFYSDPQKRATGRAAAGVVDTFTIGTVALVIPRKGIDTCIHLARVIPTMFFLWCGKLYSQVLVKPLPEELPNNVRFTGYVDDVLEMYNAFDVFLFPSYEENQGMAILEAAAVGLPLVVRDIPVYADWLRHEHNCLKAKNDEEFAQNLNRIKVDAELRQRLKEGARQLADQESLENHLSRWRSTYDRLSLAANGSMPARRRQPVVM